MDAIALSKLPIIPLIQRHASDAAFYWNQRDESITSTHLQLERLAHFDRLLQANLEGLIVAGDLGWDAALQALERWKGVSQLFVCARLALHEKSTERFPVLFKRIEAQPNLLARGLISALAWHHQHADATAPDWIRYWLETATNPLLRTIALRAASCVGVDCHEQALRDCLAELSYQRAAAFRVLSIPLDKAGNTSLANTIHQALENGLTDTAPHARAEAAISLLTHHHNQPALNILQNAVVLLTQQLNSLKGSQIKLAQRKLERWVTQLAVHYPIGDDQVGNLLDALSPGEQILFIATHGDAVFIPRLLMWADDPQLAPGVLWAIHAMTGVDAQAASIEADDDTHTASSISKFKTMPIPNAVALRAWWLTQQAQYTHRERRLLGQILPAEDSRFNDVFRKLFLHAPQAIRHLATQHYNVRNIAKFANTRASISEQLLFI